MWHKLRCDILNRTRRRDNVLYELRRQSQRRRQVLRGLWKPPGAICNMTHNGRESEMKKKSIVIIALSVVSFIVLFLFTDVFERELAKKIKGLQNGGSIRNIKITKLYNNKDPYSNGMLDNIIFKIALIEGSLTDTEIIEMGERITKLLDSEIPDTNNSNGSQIRLNVSIFPLNDMRTTLHNEKADGMSYYRQYDYSHNSFVWSSHPYKQRP